MRHIFTSLDTVNDIQPVGLYSKGTYSIVPDPVTLVDLFLNSSYENAVISFVNGVSSDPAEKDWVVSATNSLSQLYANCDKTKTIIAVVLYDPTANASIFDNASCMSYFSGYTLPNYLVLFNGFWNAGTWGPAREWIQSIDGSALSPATYIICKRTDTGPPVTNYYIVSDKFHRSTTRDGLPLPIPQPVPSITNDDLIPLNWTAVSYADLFNFIDKRRAEHEGNAIVNTIPGKGDNLYSPLSYPHMKKKSAVNLKINYNQKAVHGGLTAQYRFASYPAVAFAISNSVYPSPSSTWPLGTAESHQLTFDATSFGNETLAITSKDDTVAPIMDIIRDTSQQEFTWDTSIIFDSGEDTPVVEIEVIDPAATSYVLTNSIDPQVIDCNSFTLNVKVKTAYPSMNQPTGRILGPSGYTTQELTFTKHAVTGLVVNPGTLPEGCYTIVVDHYINNADKSVGTVARSFIVSRSAISTTVGAVAGASYFPREEGAPAAADPVWTVAGSAVGTPTAGNYLAINAAGTGFGFCQRSSTTISYSTGPTSAFPGSSISFIEACLNVTTGAASYANMVQGYDQDGNIRYFLDTGIGLELGNGPFRAVLRLLEVSNNGTSGWYKTLGLRLYDENLNVWAIQSGTTIDLSSQTMVRLEWVNSGGVFVCRAKYRSASSGSSMSTPLFSAVLSQLVVNRASSSFTASSAGFGRAQLAAATYASVNSNWEYVRYGFIDNRFSGSYLSGTILGIEKGQRTGDADYRRSPDILIGAGASNGTDELVPGSNSVSVKITCGALSPSVNVPYKLRLFTADWDETLESDVNGFSPSGFPGYCTSFSSNRTFNYINKLTGTIQQGTASTTSTLSYNFTLNNTNRKRRFILFAAVESPLHPEPLLFPAVSTASLLPIDTARNDWRYAVRQFLPDFYVRGFFGDDGSTGAGGSLSPDIALGIFKGDAAHTLPDPQGTAETLYPWGFARGEPFDSGNNPVDFAYNPNGYIEISSNDNATPKPIKLTDSGWSDYDGTVPQCYYNRSWVRISNRGIVPGPLRAQLFFLGSVLRAAFDPAAARGNAYEKIYAALPTSAAQYVQAKLQLYNLAAPGKPTIIDAVPALSGFSDPSAVKNYIIAEFVWHVGYAEVPTAYSDSHGCRAACVNLREQPAWTSGIDPAPLIDTANSIWAANQATNNIAVRNSNIVQGSAPATGDPVTMSLIIQDDSPVNYKKMPNHFKPSFSKKPAKWGLVLDAKKFNAGDVVLRVDLRIAIKADPKNMAEIRHKGMDKGPKDYRFFHLKGGNIGLLENIVKPLLPPGGLKTPQTYEAVSIFFQPSPQAKPGMYEVVLSQTADNKPVGSYRTVIALPKPGDIRFVADERTKIIYDLKTHPNAIRAVPYEQRAVFTNADFAIQQGHRFGAAKAPEYLFGKLRHEILNVPKELKYPALDKIGVLPGGLEGAVIGRVVDKKGTGIQGLQVELEIKGKRETCRVVTDENGRYLLKIKAEGKTISTQALRRSLRLAVEISRDGKKHTLLVKKFDVTDLCLALEDLVVTIPERKPGLPVKPVRVKLPMRKAAAKKARPLVKKAPPKKPKAMVKKIKAAPKKPAAKAPAKKSVKAVKAKVKVAPKKPIKVAPKPAPKKPVKAVKAKARVVPKKPVKVAPKPAPKMTAPAVKAKAKAPAPKAKPPAKSAVKAAPKPAPKKTAPAVKAPVTAEEKREQGPAKKK